MTGHAVDLARQIMDGLVPGGGVEGETLGAVREADVGFVQNGSPLEGGLIGQGVRKLFFRRRWQG